MKQKLTKSSRTQQWVKGHCEGHMFKLYDTIGNILSYGKHVQSMNALSLYVMKVIGNVIIKK